MAVTRIGRRNTGSVEPLRHGRGSESGMRPTRSRDREGAVLHLQIGLPKHAKPRRSFGWQ
jgi:hypothetical protein